MMDQKITPPASRQGGPEVNKNNQGKSNQLPIILLAVIVILLVIAGIYYCLNDQMKQLRSIADQQAITADQQLKLVRNKLIDLEKKANEKINEEKNNFLMKNYNNINCGYSFNYPSDYVTLPVDNSYDVERTAIFATNSFASPMEMSNSDVMITAACGDITTVNTLQKNIDSIMAGGAASVNPPQVMNLTINSNPATKIIVDNTSRKPGAEAESAYTVFTLFSHNNKIYSINSLSSTKQAFDNNSTNYDLIINSVSFTNP